MTSKQAIWTGAVATVVGGVVLGILSELKGWLPVREWVASLWTWLWAPGQLPHVVLVLLWCATAFAAFVLVVRVLPSRADPVASYTEAEFYGLRFRWRWASDYPASLTAFCPTCDLQVIEDHQRGGIVMRCPDECAKLETGLSDDTSPVYDDVRLRVQREARRLAGLPARQ